MGILEGIGSAISGATNIAGSLGSLIFGAKNSQIQQDTYALNKANIEWQQRQYLENRDYQRALQQTIFDREDTAYQRAVEDATSAGFSPLAALGNTANAGAVVSSSEAPAGQLQAPQLAMGDAFRHLSDSGTAFGAQLLTIAENANQRAFESEMFAQQVLAASSEREDNQLHEWLMQDAQQQALKDRDTAQHTYRLIEIESTALFQQAMQEAQHELQLKMQKSDQTHQTNMQNALLTHQANMQSSEQSHQAQMQTDAQQHQTDLQNDAQQHQMDMQKAQQDYEADYRVKTLSATWEDNWDVAEEILLPVVRKFSPELADWIQENTFGKDILVQMIATMESGLPVGQQVSDLVEGVKDNINPLSRILPGKRR